MKEQNKPKTKENNDRSSSAKNTRCWYTIPRPMVERKNKTKRVERQAKNDNQLQVYPGHYLSKTGTIFYGQSRGSCGVFLLHSRLYPFFTPNGPGIPVFCLLLLVAHTPQENAATATIVPWVVTWYQYMQQHGTASARSHYQ